MGGLLKKEIPGYKNYLITYEGRVFRKEYIKTSINKYGSYQCIKNEREIIPYKDKKGYLRCSLWIDGKQRKEMHHRLMAITFIPNPEDKPFINHKNGIKDDNPVENLEWVTASENTKHGYSTGLIVRNGSGGVFHKLQALQIPEIRELLSEGFTNKVIGEMYGVDETTISCIKLKKTWQHVSEIF